MNILIFGHVCIDKNTSENSSYVAAGGSVIFIEKVLRQFPDCQITLVSPYGPDFKKYLKEISIYPKGPIIKRTPIYENISKNAIKIQKAFYLEESTVVPIDKIIRNLIKKADLIFLAPISNYFPADYIRQIHSLKNQNSQMTLIPQCYCRTVIPDNSISPKDFTEADEILPLIDLMVVSEHDGFNMLKNAKKWAAKFGITIIITLAEKGALAINKNKTIMLPTRLVEESEIVDSVGSGDIFSAGFAYRYKQTKNLKEAGRFANELARQCLFFPAEKIKINYKSLD